MNISCKATDLLHLDGTGFKKLFDDSLAVCVSGVFNERVVDAYIQKIYALRDYWTPNYGGEQFTLGKVWYTHTDDNIKDEYFSNAKQSNSLIKDNFPELYPTVFSLISQIDTGMDVKLREGWAGPAFVIFPCEERCAQIGGSLHYDTDGISPEQMADPDFEGYSFISMFRKPRTGGGLKVWDLNIRETGEPEEDALFAMSQNQDFLSIDYELGDMIIVDSLKLHQIQPFAGEIDRVCLTYHILKNNDEWLLWF